METKEEIMDILMNYLPKEGVSKTRDKLATHTNEAIKETEKAFGGCKLCYGKGYATYRHAVSGSPDFEGDRGFTTPFEVHMLYCSCDRGKQLKELVNAKLKETSPEEVKE